MNTEDKKQILEVLVEEGKKLRRNSSKNLNLKAELILADVKQNRLQHAMENILELYFITNSKTREEILYVLEEKQYAFALISGLIGVVED